ncbi:myosin heavy chain [Dermacentor silvarum]|uniref:myosin heavy chain n=1 Tax=Dermacentor silvarum TaxID=543639 RepID=UPI00189BB736|nr:myosin heavy chain [Dermacentor silvarum]
MEKSGRQAYLESASNAEQEGPRVFAHNVATSLGERARKHQRQPTHEQGTDTELEALHKDLIGARQCYQGLPKPDTAEYGREVHRDTSVNKDLQAHISTTEQKVNKYRDKNAVLANELRRIHAQKGRLEDQLAAARVNSKLQTSRMQFTGEEGKVLRKKIQEGEEAFTMKLRSTKDQIEGRLARSQGALEKAKGENQAALREIRHLQRRIDDTSKEADAERKRGREFEEEKDKMNEQIKKLEARLHDAKRECSLEKSRRLDVKRQVEDALERREKLKRELLAACSELSSSNSTTGRFTGLRNDPRNMMVYAPNSGAP